MEWGKKRKKTAQYYPYLSESRNSSQTHIHQHHEVSIAKSVQTEVLAGKEIVAEHTGLDPTLLGVRRS